MIYIFEDGRIIYDKSLLTTEDAGKFVEFSSFPEIAPAVGKIGSITGVNIKTKEVFIEYFDILPLPEAPIPSEAPIPPEPVLTDFELIMQANIDAELRDLEIQQNQEILAQQLTNIELELLGGNV